MDSHKDNHSEDSSSSDEDGWIETEDTEDDTTTKCLFCSKLFKNLDEIYSEAIIHLKSEHQFDLKLMKSKFNMDQYSFIKMVNYIRINESKTSEFTAINKSIWDDEKYLKPIEYESWLTFDFDSLDECVQQTVSSEERIQNLVEELKVKNELLEQAANDIKRLKQTIQNMFENDTVPEDKTKIDSCSANHENDGYFGSYSHYDIHYEMLSDTVRTESYRDALYKNSESIKDQIVLDLGCGTAILSMFASKAGAKKVISVDQSDIIYNAMDIVKKNNIENIHLIKGRIEDTEIPDDKVDVIISEWMGYFLLFEGMLDSVIYARDRHLKPNGLLLPNRCNIQIAGYGNVERYKKFIDFWNNVYGFDMSSLQNDVLHEAVIEICDPQYVLTESNVIADLDLMTIDRNYSNFSYDFHLNVTKSGQITSIVGYFDTFFNLPANNVFFSTSPQSIPTHWKQVVFYFRNLVEVSAGETIKGKIKCRRDAKDIRALVIEINVFDKTMTYNLN